jgi:hypothetical protein
MLGPTDRIRNERPLEDHDEVRPRPQGAWRGEFRAGGQRGAFDGKHTSFYDLFRIENGKVGEHWDAIETIPPRGQWKNDNGKFGFREESSSSAPFFPKELH